MKAILQYHCKRIFFLTSLFFFLTANAQYVTTMAGSTPGLADGPASTAQFFNPNGVAIDAAGNLYVADRLNHRIRKITTAGVVSNLAGSTLGFADGNGTAAQFNHPRAVAVAADGTVFVADTYNHRIRKITPTGLVTTLAGTTAGYVDGLGVVAKFFGPFGLTVDPEGNVFVADGWNNRIRKITPAGKVTTVAGSTQGSADGTGTAAQFYTPAGVALDALGNLYVADMSNHRIRKITPDAVVTTIAGSTPGFADDHLAFAQFYDPTGLTVDTAGNIIVADWRNNRIRKISNGVVTTLAGLGIAGFDDNAADQAQFDSPMSVAVDASGTVFVADALNNRIRKITVPLATTSYQLENEASVYPNPTTSIINIELKDTAAAKVMVFNINGKALLSKNIIEHKSAINLQDFTNGIYLIKISTANGNELKKIVKR